jgi:hypothetical protein
MTPSTFTLEAAGRSPAERDRGAPEALGIQELVRTGKVAIARGSKTARRRPEEPLGKSADAQRCRRDTESNQDPRVTGFAD